jgi:hypothetical protein
MSPWKPTGYPFRHRSEPVARMFDCSHFDGHLLLMASSMEQSFAE